ncbi:Chitinase [hydrothermal vent metagenome]|uniref:Chitinase n=1 Tax=hydrothermal vent metagenome TaxID=652676 RepID=A0A1W1CZM0_9ZZZZ
MEAERKANAQHVTTAQNKLRNVEFKKAQKAKKDRDTRLAQLEQERCDREKKEAQDQREAQRKVESSKDVFVDSSTGLMWQDDGDAKTVMKNWSDAKRYCQNLTLAGRSDWYLQDKEQLLGVYTKKIRLEYISSWYWSSTTYADGTDYAWIVHFDSGNDNINAKDSNLYVRCVRDGE